MQVDAGDSTVEQMFKQGKFIIPKYQREYDWNDNELNEFYNDIDNTNIEDEYFIGPIVVVEKDKTTFEVIDGQQRITTITILLCVLRDLFYSLGEAGLTDGINAYIFNKKANGELFSVLVNQMPYPVLQTYVQDLPEDKNLDVVTLKQGEIKIKKAYDKYQKLLKNKSKDQLEIWRDKLLNLITIFVKVDDEVNAFTIFETLNDRGKDLTPFDLIKNRIFMSYPVRPHLNEPEDTWKMIKENCKNYEEKFLNNFWASRYKKVATRVIYKAFVNSIIKTSTDLPNTTKNFINDMYSDSIIFSKIINPNMEDWKEITNGSDIYFSLKAIRTFRVDIANGILLSLVRHYNNKKLSFAYLIKCMDSIEKFHFEHTAISSGKGSGLDTFYAKHSRDLFQAEDKVSSHIVLDKFIEDLKTKQQVIIFEDFKNLFIEKLVYSRKEKGLDKNKSLVQYVLNKLENSLSSTDKILLNSSIEHVYPETPEEGWSELSDPLLKFTIGNLILLDRDLNSGLGNKPFNTKKEAILEEASDILTSQKAMEEENWDEQVIRNRNDAITYEAYHTIWKIT